MYDQMILLVNQRDSNAEVLELREGGGGLCGYFYIKYSLPVWHSAVWQIFSVCCNAHFAIGLVGNASASCRQDLHDKGDVMRCML